ncbi:MFS transporter [Rhizobium sp. R635]|uniref:MFS transporter n=1 Tax=Rhizobium sp. R635 TaxID=1764275 RepID=UPI000B538721|nr:MFS transporter [Rhizobium sp. R635]OWV87655.1 MFS transporter [Rhizobium sp. R635]
MDHRSASRSGSESLIRGRPEQIATRVVFFVLGFCMGGWAPLIPFVKERTGIPDGSVGLLLLLLGLGSIIAMPLSGRFAHRFGCRSILLLSCLSVCGSLPFLGYSGSLAVIGLTLFFFGAGIGAMDSTINIMAVIVERAGGRPMMSGFHGMFSVGGIFGAGGPVAIMAAGYTPFAAAVVVSFGSLAAMALVSANLLRFGAGGSFRYALPKGPVLLISVLCFVLFLAEGVVLDWSGIFLTTLRGIRADYAGLGYASFAAAMTFGRLIGDWLVRKIGPRKIVVVGSIGAASGLFVATVIPQFAGILAGYFLAGFGCANIVPVLFSAIGRQNIMPASVAIPTITTIGYSGILLGPALVGFVAHAADLSAAFLGISGLLVLAAIAGTRLR